MGNIDTEILTLINGSGNELLDSIAMTLTCPYTWIPLYIILLYLTLKNNDSHNTFFFIITCVATCVILTGLTDDFIVKPYFHRLRPINDPNVAPLLHIVEGMEESSYSFFSAHSANTMSVAVFLILLIRSHIMTFLLLSWSLLNAWTRLYLGAHFPSDVLVGLLWGMIVGILVFMAFNKISHTMEIKRRFISSQFTSTGFRILDIDLCAVVYILTLLFALFIAIL